MTCSMVAGSSHYPDMPVYLCHGKVSPRLCSGLRYLVDAPSRDPLGHMPSEPCGKRGLATGYPPAPGRWVINWRGDPGNRGTSKIALTLRHKSLKSRKVSIKADVG